TEDDAEQRMPKAVAAKRHLQRINSDVHIEAHIVDVTPTEFEWLIDGVNLIIDATDNFDIRMMINDMSQKHHIPWIYGSCVGSYAISYTNLPNEFPCLYFLIQDVSMGGLTRDTGGIISPAAIMVIVLQTTEALKILTENKHALRKTLVRFDMRN